MSRQSRLHLSVVTTVVHAHIIWWRTNTERMCFPKEKFPCCSCEFGCTFQAYLSLETVTIVANPTTKTKPSTYTYIQIPFAHVGNTVCHLMLLLLFCSFGLFQWTSEPKYLSIFMWDMHNFRSFYEKTKKSSQNNRYAKPKQKFKFRQHFTAILEQQRNMKRIFLGTFYMVQKFVPRFLLGTLKFSSEMNQWTRSHGDS